jgi:hypothetical protein
MNGGLFWGGLILFGASYGAGVVFGAANGFSNGLGVVAVPFIGPFLAIGSRDLSCSVSAIGPTTDPAAEANACQGEVVSEVTTIATLSAVGVIQVFGGGLSLIGLLDRRNIWVRQETSTGSLRWDTRILPGGLAFEGTF